MLVEKILRILVESTVGYLIKNSLMLVEKKLRVLV